MFRREADMSASVTDWLLTAGLQTKQEFVTPWGICDLAGVGFDRERVAHRLQLRQRKPLTSITRAALLLKLPDVESGTSISQRRLTRVFAGALSKDTIESEVERLIADGFAIRAHGRLQKLNGWMPIQNRVVAVELKLKKVEEAMKQAKANLGFAEESYVAFPMPTALRIANTSAKWGEYFADGIGVLGVLPKGCDIVIPTTAGKNVRNPAIQLYCVEKFWGMRPRSFTSN